VALSGRCKPALDKPHVGLLASVMDHPQATPRQQLLVFWVLWAAFQVGVCIQYKFLHRPMPAVADESLKWLVAAAPLLVSIFIRWNVIPQIRVAGKLLPTMIIGIALAETTAFLGIFLFPAHQWDLFVGSFLGIAQFAPTYAGRFFADGGEDTRGPS
jgi:hypothetical protein